MGDPRYTVTYDSNNSGGTWWLTDDDWKALEGAGWTVDWVDDSDRPAMGMAKDGRFLGALAMHASIDTDDPDAAIAEWSRVTGQDPASIGCNCCGPPHSFDVYDHKTGKTTWLRPDEPPVGTFPSFEAGGAP